MVHMTANSVFISYRREDTAGEAGRLAEHLERRLGTDRVFFDIEAIAPGTDFVDELSRALDESSVMIVMIGRGWLTAANADGSRRLDDPKDFVHLEIASALERHARVIPVLVHNVLMPSADVLPTALVPLATRQAMSIQHEEFVDDAERIADAIAGLLGAGSAITAIAASGSVSAGRSVRSKRGPIVSVAVAATMALGFLAVRWQGSSSAAKAVAAASADSVLRVRQTAVDELITVATEQGKRKQYAEAVSTLDRAVAMDANVQRAKGLREDLSMTWIRNLSVTDGETFTHAMIRPLAVLDFATPSARGSRQGDMLAHLGWAMFLRWRDNRSAPEPPDAYRRALAVDAANPFANVMLGHWILAYENGPNALDSARAYFRVAADAGRATDEVRRFQLAALGNAPDFNNELETIRVLNEMRTRDEPRASSARTAWRTYYYALNGQASITVSDLMTLLPASEHVQTLRWAFTEYAQRDEGTYRIFRFYVARLRAQTGEVDSAADSLRVIRKELGDDSGRLRDAVDAALTQYGSGRVSPD